jgi:2-polyprenyl-3-methyl-5-hydroxy-6-metoxy-1,4-benzoquinol methylase
MHIERIEPNTKEWRLYYANHIVRYKFARDIIILNNKKTILDIACGVGYGTNLLASENDIKIVGVDIDDETLKIAKKLYNSRNISFIKDDANELRVINKKKFEVIISFETVEHIKNYQYFIEEIYKMLLPAGIAIISTPNLLVSKHYSRNDWHFHEKEFTPNEFYELLRNCGFDNIELYGQQYTDIGLLRKDVRHELNILRSNPFYRFGSWIQKKLKGYIFDYPLAEREVDFQIKSFSVEHLSKIQENSPFVTIAVCKKK